MSHEAPEVQDKKSEFRALVNNILTFLILAVMTWVGTNITQMRDSLSSLTTSSAVVNIEIKHLKEHNAMQDKTLEAHNILLSKMAGKE